MLRNKKYELVVGMKKLSRVLFTTLMILTLLSVTVSHADVPADDAAIIDDVMEEFLLLTAK